MLIGSIAAAAHGLCLPMISIVFGGVTGNFMSSDLNCAMTTFYQTKEVSVANGIALAYFKTLLPNLMANSQNCPTIAAIPSNNQQAVSFVHLVFCHLLN